MASFSIFNFHPSLNEALEMMGFEKPTPIQEKAIPIILDQKDLIACAQTGTGKTAAFLLPILNKLATNPTDNHIVSTVVIAPTRELAKQIDQQIEGFGYFVGASSLPVYGGGDGTSWDQQKVALTKGADIIVATPGRLIAHIQLGYVDFSKVQHLILDEADRMLDMGFYDDIMTIVKQMPKKRQNLMFSATMPSNIRKLAKSILNNPEQINIAISKPAEGVLQGAYLTYDNQKIALIEHLLTGKTNYASVIIFASTRRIVKEISDTLQRKRFSAATISSDLEQKDREAALLDFKNKKTQIIVATDILARGIDIKEISLIINYDVPNDAEDYVHRVGRTARADSTGVALTFISPKDMRKFAGIERLIEMEIKKIPLPTELGEGPAYEPNKRQSGGGRNFKGRSGGGDRNRGDRRQGDKRGGGGNRNKRGSSNRGRNDRRDDRR